MINSLEKELCKDCEFNKTFLCEKNLLFEIERYLPFKLEIFKAHISNRVDIIEESYKVVLERHRRGRYFVFNLLPKHCSTYTEKCKCDHHRCWNFEEVPARKIPRCIKLFGINPDSIESIKNILDTVFFLIDFTECKRS